jgi:hypothetical protein
MEGDSAPDQGNSGARRDDREGGDEELIQIEVACCNLEESISRIPKSREDPDFRSAQKIKEKSTVVDDCKGCQAIQGGERVFGHSMEDLFNHSWRPTRKNKWIWVSKLMVLGAQEYPARADKSEERGGVPVG